MTVCGGSSNNFGRGLKNDLQLSLFLRRVSPGRGGRGGCHRMTGDEALIVLGLMFLVAWGFYFWGD